MQYRDQNAHSILLLNQDSYCYAAAAQVPLIGCTLDAALGLSSGTLGDLWSLRNQSKYATTLHYFAKTERQAGAHLDPTYGPAAPQLKLLFANEKSHFEWMVQLPSALAPWHHKGPQTNTRQRNRHRYPYNTIFYDPMIVVMFVKDVTSYFLYPRG